MNKKVIVSVFVVLILAVAGGGFFWWWQGREIKGSPEDYVIVERPEGKFVENKKAGLSVKVPEGWETRKMEIREGSVLTYALDIEGRKEGEFVAPPLTKGCGIEISTVYREMNFAEIEEEAKAIHWGLQTKSEEFEEITVGNYRALQNTFDSEILGPVVTIYIPKGGKLYDFSLYFAVDEKKRCIQEFDKFLETISVE